VSVANSKLKIKTATAQEICARYKLSPEAAALLAEKMPPLDFLAALEGAELFRDAVQFLAYALPKREAVWWSGLCSRDVLPAAGKPELGAAVEAAEAWVYRPTEENRRKAQAATRAIAEPHAAQWTAMGAFWSGGSMAPPDCPEVKPPDDLTPRAVAGGIVMAATSDPKLAADRFRRYVACGLDIANGGTGRPPTKS
jgi:hypothetical protein